MKAVRRLGPHPVLIGRMAGHVLSSRRRIRRLRRAYDDLVLPRVEASIDVAPLTLPPASELPPELHAAAQRIKAEAESIRCHYVDYLGSGPVSLGDEIDWHQDFKSGHTWPKAFYLDIEVTRMHDASDAKVPWELSRGHQLLTLARAAALFRDERYADELERQLDSWLSANPPGVGINWVNTMEVAIRAVNWIWAVRTLEGWRPLEADLRRRVSASLQAHGRHIALNLEGSPVLRSNHFLADLLGLLVVGWALRGDPAAGGWFTSARRQFGREMRRQVHSDGVGFEASLPYHGLALEIFLLAHYVASEAGWPQPHWFTDHLTKMASVSRSVRHPDGRTPLFGDGDSGRVLPSGFDRPPSQDQVLWLATAILGAHSPTSKGPPGDEVAWTLGIDIWRRAWARVRDLPEFRCAFPKGGLYVLRGQGTHVVVRCAGVGQNGNGGHSHNDQLSYELSGTTPLVVDSGTYAYTFDPVARNCFRGTAAHNTVMVDDSEINPIDELELFRLRGFAHPRVESWEDSVGYARLVTAHDGYRRLPGRVRHRRTFEVDKSSGALTVMDELLGQGRHRAVSYLHLAHGVELNDEGDGSMILSTRSASARLEMWGTRSVEVQEGWISDRYGVRHRAPVIVATTEESLPMRFGHRVTPSVATTAVQRLDTAAR